MKVFVVRFYSSNPNDLGSHDVLGVFSSREKAEAAICDPEGEFAGLISLTTRAVGAELFELQIDGPFAVDERYDGNDYDQRHVTSPINPWRHGPPPAGRAIQ